MKNSIYFFGAVGGVTGSRSLLEWEGFRVLIDCGLYQGPKEVRQNNWTPFQIEPKTISAVVLTHAHIDHSGYLPKLVKEGFGNEIHCSEGTAKLCKILLPDSAKLQEEDSDYANRTRHSHHDPALPLYTAHDADQAVKLLVAHKFEEWISLSEHIRIRFLRAGHIVGSSFVQFHLSRGDQNRTVTFSGDIGHDHSVIMRGPTQITETDDLILESTYGDRLHDRERTAENFADILKRTLGRGGVLVIPAFAVGRSQEVLYLIRKLEDEGLIPSVPVLLDSPMSRSASEIFFSATEDQHDFLRGKDPSQLVPKNFKFISNVDESMLSCMRTGPLVVVSAAGMLSGGRILHHLKSRLADEKNTVLFVGYQAEGSKGRFLQDNAKTFRKIRIHHQEVEVNAEIATITGLSAHGDSKDIVEWLSHFHTPPKRIFLNHGTVASEMALQAHLKNELGWDSTPLLQAEKISLS